MTDKPSEKPITVVSTGKTVSNSKQTEIASQQNKPEKIKKP